jgi:hypothetical protein
MAETESSGGFMDFLKRKGPGMLMGGIGGGLLGGFGGPQALGQFGLYALLKQLGQNTLTPGAGDTQPTNPGFMTGSYADGAVAGPPNPMHQQLLQQILSQGGLAAQ